MYKQTLASVYFWVVIVLLWLYVIGYCEVKLGVWRFVLIWKKTIFDRLFDVLSLGVWFIILYCECVFTLDLSKRNHFIALYFISILWFSTTCPSSFPCLVTLLSPLNPHGLQFLQKTVSHAPFSLLMLCFTRWALEVWIV